MLRQSILLVALLSFFVSSSFSVAADRGELSKQFSKAQSLAAQGEITLAITVYQSLILSNPLLPEAYNNLAALYLKQNNTKQAKHILEQGLYAHKGYGVLYESLTAINVAMAREAYSKALQIDLKPSAITIASLSLNKNKSSNKKNTIVISKVNKPAGETKAIVNKAKASGKIKRISDKVKPKATSNKQVKNTETLEDVIQAWSAAWSAQAVDMYLSFYHKQYKPLNGLSHKGWIQSRRYRLKKPRWIKIGLSDFEIKKNTGKQAVVNFKQLYQSNSFRDVSAKQMVLLYTNDGWRIFREKSL